MSNYIDNEAQIRKDKIDPHLLETGWETKDGIKAFTEFPINKGQIQLGGSYGERKKVDYLLTKNGANLGIIEAKSTEETYREGIQQAKEYARLLDIRFTYASDGDNYYQIDTISGDEKLVDRLPTPDELWEMTFSDSTNWEMEFRKVPLKLHADEKSFRYYQKIAVERTMRAIAENKKRILLTLATGTGKTFLAFQVAWKLYQTNWNNGEQTGSKPRILFLADRNILANQAFNAFDSFDESELKRISPKSIRQNNGRPQTSGSIFFTIFQTFMTGNDEELEENETTSIKTFEEYPPDFFDVIIVDECHRGGASDESSWRAILEYFEPAVQIGLTATPKRDANVDTYAYFGDPIYEYSLKQGIEDGYLTPYKVKRITDTLDEYIYNPNSDDEVLQGNPQPGEVFRRSDFNRKIEIKEREEYRVKTLLSEINLDDKTLIFCVTQRHAALISELINQNKLSEHPDYCHRVTADDGELGELHLRNFQDNQRKVPTILTTSRKLSTGVDARNVRNIVLLKDVKNMVEFKQIIGRGTRLYEGKNYFTIYDFESNHENFKDEEWDGLPVEDLGAIICGSPDNEPEITEDSENFDPQIENLPVEIEDNPKIVIKLSEQKMLELEHTTQSFFYSKKNNLISAEEFIQELFDTCQLPDVIGDENKLKELWITSESRNLLLEKLKEFGFELGAIEEIGRLINSNDADVYDILEFIAFNSTNLSRPISKKERVEKTSSKLLENLNEDQSAFIKFLIERYLDEGVESINENNLSTLLKLKYESITKAEEVLGEIRSIKNLFLNFQNNLYSY
tara:strand:- start:153 stop:2546 length:2394 start_codon:yes stop_codon:yes gene_type:complete